MDVPRRATLKDVARASGVSATTVSFVLNETAGQTIPEVTRERVMHAAQRLGYSPHRVARTLREGRSRTVVLMIGELRGGNSLDSFIHGMREELRTLEYTLAVLAGATGDRSSAEFLETVAPTAVLDLPQLYAEDAVGVDGGWTDGLAAHARTQLGYLAERGHRHVAVAVPADGMGEWLVQTRLGHLREAARKVGMETPVLFRVAGSAEGARSALDGLRSEHSAVTAIAAFDDETALRVLAAMADLALRAPDDLAVIGFDESPLAALWRPSLTTVRIDAETFGRRAARAALGLEAEEWTSPPSVVVARSSA